MSLDDVISRNMYYFCTSTATIFYLKGKFNPKSTDLFVSWRNCFLSNKIFIFDELSLLKVKVVITVK